MIPQYGPSFIDIIIIIVSLFTQGLYPIGTYKYSVDVLENSQVQPSYTT